jgi:hypothetical protein
MKNTRNRIAKLLEEMKGHYDIMEVNKKDNYIILNYSMFWDNYPEHLEKIAKEREYLKVEIERILKHLDITIFLDEEAITSTF